MILCAVLEFIHGWWMMTTTHGWGGASGGEGRGGGRGVRIGAAASISRERVSATHCILSHK